MLKTLEIIAACYIALLVFLCVAAAIYLVVVMRRDPPAPPENQHWSDPGGW